MPAAGRDLVKAWPVPFPGGIQRMMTSASNRGQTQTPETRRKAAIQALALPPPSAKAAQRVLEQVLRTATAKPSVKKSAESRKQRREAFDAASDLELLDNVVKGDEVAWEAF